jgi:GNAT superfamily N-acetyltransferase
MPGNDVKDRVTMRLYREGDETQLVELHNKVFRVGRTMEQWRWQYLQNPSGFAMSVVAEIDGRIVGQYAAVLHRFRFFDREIISYHIVDVMVDPELRRLGISSRTANFAFDFFGPGVTIGHGFPTLLHYTFGIRKLGYEKICFFPKYCRPLTTTSLFKNLVRNRRLVRLTAPFGYIPYALCTIGSKSFRRPRNLDIVPVERFDERADRFWKRAASTAPIICIRDRAFLEWRFLSRPGSSYSVFGAMRGNDLVGYIALSMDERPYKRLGIIEDLLVVGDEPDRHLIMDALIEKGVSFLGGQGAEQVNTFMLHRSYRQRLKRMGFFRFPSDYVIVARSFKPDITREHLCVPDNWFLSIADTDWYHQGRIAL